MSSEPAETAPPPSIRIAVRHADAADLPFVEMLAERFGMTRAPWRTFEEVVNGTRRQLGDAFAAARPGDAVFIAVDERGERLGFAYVVTSDDFFTGQPHGHVSEIATRADGGGAGSALMAACESWSREAGHRYLSLNVNDANEDARRFYERREYVPEYRHLIKLL